MGIFMDEGIASGGDEYPVFYGQRCAWWLTVLITGGDKHGRGFAGADSVGNRMRRILDKWDCVLPPRMYSLSLSLSLVL